MLFEQFTCANVWITSHLFYTQNFSIQYITIVKVAGSFRLAAGTSHLHEDFNFTELVLETAGQSLRHSCRTPIKCQGVSLPLDRQNYSRRLLGVRKKAYYFFFLIFQHRAGVSLNTSFYKLAETCAFIKQSLSSILCQLLKVPLS